MKRVTFSNFIPAPTILKGAIIALVSTILFPIGALAESYTNQNVTITWPMVADNAVTTVGYVSIPATGTASWDKGSNVNDPSGTVTYSEITFAKITNASKLDNKKSKVTNNYIDYSFTVTEGLTFTPTGVTFDIIKNGTGDPNIFVDFFDGSTPYSVANGSGDDPTGVAIRRNDTSTSPEIGHNYSGESFPSITATSNKVTLRIYIGKLPTDKSVGIANVVISGKVNGTLSSTTYTITTAANPAEGGSITGGGSYDENATATLTATANSGYTFSNWTKASDSSTLTDNPLNITVTADETYTANFQQESSGGTSTVNDLVAISSSYVFVADDITSNGTTALTANTLYNSNFIFSPKGNNVAANKGSVTFNGGSHLNSLRLKNTDNQLCFKVSAPCTVTFYTQSHESRGIQVGSTAGGTEYGTQTASTTSWSCDITSAGVVYLSSYGGDFFIAGFEVTFPTVETPTYTLGAWDADNSKYAVTLSCATEGATIHYSTDSKATYSDYTAALSLAPGTTLDAYATKDGWIQSDNMATYTVPAAPSATQYTLTFNTPANGTINWISPVSPTSGTKYDENTTISFTLSSATDYEVDYVKNNGTALTATSGTYSFPLTADASIEVAFKAQPAPSTPIDIPTAANSYVDLSKGVTAGSISYKSENDAMESIKDGGNVTFSVNATEAGNYIMSLAMRRMDGNNKMTIDVYNGSDIESTTEYTWTRESNEGSSYDSNIITIPLNGTITSGNKTIRLTFNKITKNSSDYICNFKNLRFDRDNVSSVTGITAAGGLTVTEGTAEGDPDWKIDVPADYEGTNVTFTPAVHHGTIVVKQGETTLTATDGAYSITTPEPGESATINITLTPTDNTYTAAKTEYTLSISRGGFKLPSPEGQYVDLSKGVRDGSINYNATNNEMNSIKDGGNIMFSNAIIGTAGYYVMSLKMRRYNGTNKMTIDVDGTSTEYTWTLDTSESGYGSNVIMVPINGTLTTGEKTVKLTFNKTNKPDGGSDFICNFKELRFDLAHKLTIGATSNGSVAVTSPEGAAADGEGKYTFAEGASITVTATPAEGYKVKTWKKDGNDVDGETGSTYTFQMGTADMTVTAEFEEGLPQHTLTFNTPANGSINWTSPSPAPTSGSSYDENTTISFTLSPASGYEVDYVKNNGTALTATSGTYSFQLTADASIVVAFKAQPAPSTPIAIPTAASTYVDLSKGVTAGSISYKSDRQSMESIKDGGNVTFSANCSTVGTYMMTLAMRRYDGSNKMTVDVDGTTTDYTWTLDASETGYGVITVPLNGTLTTDNKTIKLTFNKTNKPDGGSDYICNFKDLRFDLVHKLTISAGEHGSVALTAPAGATLTGGKYTIAEGTSVTLTATPAEGYKVKAWKKDGTAISGETGLNYTFQMGTSDVTISAEFESGTQPAEKFKLTLGDHTNGTMAITSPAGTTPGSDGKYTFENGTEITLKATPNRRYKLDKWTDGNNQKLGNKTALTYTITSDITINAVFAQKDEPTTTITIPTTGDPIDLTAGLTEGAISYKAETNAMESIKDGGYVTFKVNAAANCYDLKLRMKRYAGANKLNIAVFDNTGALESETDYGWTEETKDYEDFTIPLNDKLTAGTKIIELAFLSEGIGYICNFKDLRFAANNAGMVTSVTSTSDDVTVTTEDPEPGSSTNWVMTIPAEPTGALATNVPFNPQERNGNISSISATQDGDPVVVNGPDASGNYSVPTPDYGKETVVTMVFSPTVAAARGFTRAGEISYTLLVKRGGVTLPTAAGKAINLGNGVLAGSGALQKEGTVIGNTRNDTKYALLLNNPSAQDYYLSFQTGSKYDNIILNVKVSKNDGSATYLNKDITLTNTGGWDPKATNRYKLPMLPTGLHRLEISVKQKSAEGNECGNWGNFAINTGVYDDIPGTAKLENGVLNGTIRNQKDANGNITNVGYVRKGDTATYPLKCTKAGVYEMAMKISPYKDCTMNIVIKHEDTGAEEVNMDYPITKKAGNKIQKIMLDGELTTGAKLMIFTFKYDGSDNPNLVNYEAPVFTHKADHLATIAGVSVVGQTVTKGTNTDWYVELPETMSKTNVTFTPDVKYGKVSIKAKQDGKDVSVKDNNDGTFTVTAPDASHSMNLTMTIKPNTGAIAARDEFTMRMLRLGPVTLNKVEIDGICIDDKVLADLNKNATATHKAVYTVLPEVKALVISGDSATVSEPVVSGTMATYTITGKVGSKATTFKLVVDGVHIYEAKEGDGVIPLLYTVEGRNDDKTTWSDGLYTVESAKIDGWGSGRFKFNSDFSTLVLPSDVVVKRMVLKELKANSKSAKANAGLTSVTSDGATVWMPAKHTYAYGDDNQYDLVLTIDNHKPSEPIMFKFTGGGQPVAWIEMVVQYVNPHTAPVIRDVTITPTDQKNHCVVAVTFDRQMQATTINMGGKKVTAEEGGILYFPFWDLDYNRTYTFKLPAGTAKDKYGNTNGTGYESVIKIGPKPTFDKVPYDYVVSSIQELREAIASVNMSNEEADAERKVIFIRNGSYNIGSDVKGPDYATNSKDITRQAEELNLNAYNVSLIGESMTGVDLHGERTGISYPILQINNTSGNYMQDLTVTNDWDFGKPRDGVAVAISGGKRAIFNRVRMRSQQDTQVTGESGYYLNCEIYGAVDYICGSGNHYYDNCKLLMTNPGPITAPSTLSTQKWGYVFQNCTIDAADGAVVGDNDYMLGRPWKNEPSAYFLNTHMLIEPSKEGWSAMGKLKTHFYEYNSQNANGEAIDLSVRKNSPTSTNTYTPVLTADEAKKFTVRNVLGTTDSWLPTEDTYETRAVKLSLDDTILSWTEVDSVRCYVIFRDGQYYDNVVSNVYRATEDGEYTIRTANQCGGLGKASNMVVVYGLGTGIADRPLIDEKEESGEVRYYSLSGVQLSQPQKGINIMVIKTSQGYKSKKVIIK